MIKKILLAIMIAVPMCAMAQTKIGVISADSVFQIAAHESIVPLAELYKYSTTLSSLTSGRATFTMEYAEYAQVPSDVQEKLLKAYQEEEGDE